MANRTATLIRYANIPNLGWRRGTLITAKNGRIKPDYMVYNGAEVHCPQGGYQIRYYEGSKALHKSVGNDLDVAQTALDQFVKKMQLEVLNVELGIKMPEQVQQKEERKTIADLCPDFVTKYAVGGHDTVRNYKFISAEFTKLAAQRGKTYPDQLTEDDVIAFDRHLEQTFGHSKTTRVGMYVYTRCFLKYLGLNLDKLISAEWNQKLKRKPKTLPVIYTEQQLEKLYAVASDYHRLAWKCYRMLGFRDQELAYLEWENIDWEAHTAEIKFKPELDWVSKDYEERVVPIPNGLYEELRMWREKHPKTRFVVGTKADKPNVSFLKALRSDWKDAGLNCGRCSGCLGKEHYCHDAKLKTFRSTYLTTMLGHCKSPRDVQALAGHSSLVTTQKYLRPAAMDSLQAAVNAAFD